MTKTALIVDDNPENLDALALLLRKEGFKPTTAQTLKELYAALDSQAKVDVVFLDLEFPNYSGFQVIGTLRRDERLTNTPIVAYSVHTSELNEARDAGFDSFIGKPLMVERFPSQLQRIMAGESIWEVGN